MSPIFRVLSFVSLACVTGSAISQQAPSMPTMRPAEVVNAVCGHIKDIDGMQPDVKRRCFEEFPFADDATYARLTTAYCNARRDSDHLAWLEKVTSTCRFPNQYPVVPFAARIVALGHDRTALTLVDELGIQGLAAQRHGVLSRTHIFPSHRVSVAAAALSAIELNGMSKMQPRQSRSYWTMMMNAEGCQPPPIPNPPSFCPSAGW